LQRDEAKDSFTNVSGNVRITGGLYKAFFIVGVVLRDHRDHIGIDVRRLKIMFYNAGGSPVLETALLHCVYRTIYKTQDCTAFYRRIGRG
jgi:hypothetical protein